MKRIGTKRVDGGSPSRFVLVAFLAVLAISSGSCSGSGGSDGAVLPTSLPPSLPSPRNVIVMIADGGGYAQLDAADAYVHGSLGARCTSTFPVRLAMETSSFAQKYDPVATWQDFSFCTIFLPSSNASATALSSGKSTWGLYLGLDSSGQPVEHFFQRASAAGKSTGAVTSVPISHATPAGFVVHQTSRFSYEAIAMEMLTGSSLDLLMGCGHPHYDEDGVYVASPDADAFKYVGGSTTWDALEAGTLGNDADGDGIDDPWALLTSRAEVLALATDPAPPKRVFALAPNVETLQRNRGGDHMAAPDTVAPLANQPTLVEFAAGALNVLSRNPAGFALVIEGGAVDWACHANEAGRMIEEQRDFDETVEAVVRVGRGPLELGRDPPRRHGGSRDGPPHRSRIG